MRNVLMLLAVCGLSFTVGCNQSGSQEAGSTTTDVRISPVDPGPDCCCEPPDIELDEPFPIEDYEPQAEPPTIASESTPNSEDI